MNKMKKDFKLEQLPKHNIYQVPEHYFDRLPMRVMEQTAQAEGTHISKLLVFWQTVRMAVAPVVLLMVFVGVYFFSMQQTTPPEQAIAGPLSSNDILEYLSYNTDLETTDFAELNSLSKQELTADFINISPTVAEEELEYYHLSNFED